jgi:hypothetical protein
LFRCPEVSDAPVKKEPLYYNVRRLFTLTKDPPCTHKRTHKARARAHRFLRPEARGVTFQHNKIIIVPKDIVNAHALVPEKLVLYTLFVERRQRA